MSSFDNRETPAAREHRLRSVAVQLVAQLPEGLDDKRVALQYATELLEIFFGKPAGDNVRRLHSIADGPDKHQQT